MTRHNGRSSKADGTCPCKLGLHHGVCTGWRAALRRVEFWADARDRGDSAGPFRKFIWQPVSEAVTRYRAERNRYVNRFLELLQTVEPTLKPGKIALRSPSVVLARAMCAHIEGHEHPRGVFAVQPSVQLVVRLEALRFVGRPRSPIASRNDHSGMGRGGAILGASFTIENRDPWQRPTRN